MADFKKLFYALGLAVLLSCIASEADGGPFVPSEMRLTRTVNPPATSIVLDTTDSVFDLRPEFARGRSHQYFYLQTLGIDRMYRLPDIHLVELEVKPYPPVNFKLKGKKAGWTGRRNGRHNVRMM